MTQTSSRLRVFASSRLRVFASSRLRVFALLSLTLFAWPQLGCSEATIAQTDVDHGTGAVVPANVADDQNVMGGKVGTLDVSTASLDGLRADLDHLFGGVFANGLLVVNPSVHLGLPGNAGCSQGKQHACLEAVDSNDTEDVSGLGIRPFGPAAALVEGNDPRLAPGGLAFLTLNHNAVVDLTTFENGRVAPNSLGANLAMILPDRDDIRVKITVDSVHATIQNRGSKTGLWVPLVLEVEDPGVRHHHCNAVGDGTATGTLSPAICKRVVQAAEKYDCSSVDLQFKLNRLRLYIGFIPSKKPACDAYAPTDSVTAWMKDVPLGHAFDQPCLAVTPVLQVALSASPFEFGGDMEVEAHVDTDFCSEAAKVGCATVVDCDGKATDGMIPQVEQQVPAMAAPQLNALVTPYLASDGSAYADPSAPQCDFKQNAACLKPLIAASVAQITYAWFANPFTDSRASGTALPCARRTRLEHLRGLRVLRTGRQRTCPVCGLLSRLPDRDACIPPGGWTLS